MLGIFKEKMIVLIFYIFTIVPLFTIIFNIIGEETLKSFTPNRNSTSNIIRSLSEDLSRSIGMDTFFKNLNQDI